MSIKSKLRNAEKLATEAMKAMAPKTRALRYVAAETRGDTDLAQRLRDTCPEYTYRMVDADFRDSSMAMMGMGNILMWTVDKWRERTRSFEAQKVMLEEVGRKLEEATLEERATEGAAKAADAGAGEFKPMLDAMLSVGGGSIVDTLKRVNGRMAEESKGAFAADWQGYDKLIQRQFGIDAMTLLEAVDPEGLLVAWAEDALQTEPDPEAAAAIGAGWADMWAEAGDLPALE